MFINFIGKSFYNIRFLVFKMFLVFFCLVVMILNIVNVSKDMGRELMCGFSGFGFFGIKLI